MAMKIKIKICFDMEEVYGYVSCKHVAMMLMQRDVSGG